MNFCSISFTFLVHGLRKRMEMQYFRLFYRNKLENTNQFNVQNEMLEKMRFEQQSRV